MYRRFFSGGAESETARFGGLPALLTRCRGVPGTAAIVVFCGEPHKGLTKGESRRFRKRAGAVAMWSFRDHRRRANTVASRFGELIESVMSRQAALEVRAAGCGG